MHRSTTHRLTPRAAWGLRNRAARRDELERRIGRDGGGYMSRSCSRGSDATCCLGAARDARRVTDDARYGARTSDALCCRRISRMGSASRAVRGSVGCGFRCLAPGHRGARPRWPRAVVFSRSALIVIRRLADLAQIVIRAGERGFCRWRAATTLGVSARGWPSAPRSLGHALTRRA
jgi:hypothetical protein